MRTDNTTATADTTTAAPRTRNRKPAPRVEQLRAATDAAPATVDLTEQVLSHADSAIAKLAAGATTPEGAARLLAAATRHAHSFIRSTG